MGRPPKSVSAPGVHLRGKQYWLRYSFQGEQIRVPLGTTDPAEANFKADELRGKPPKGQAGGAWQTELKRYLLAKSETGKHKPSTSEKIRYAVKQFFKWTGCTSAPEVTKNIVMGYYEAHRSPRPDDEAKRKKGKKGTSAKPGDYRNTATAQGYVTSVCAFLRWCGNRLTTSFPREEVPTKKLTIRRERADKLINKTPRLDLRFILYAGFYAGMRKEEIVMSRPAWFDLENSYINIPSIEESHGRFFETKSGRSRRVPLDPKFHKFLKEEYTEWHGQRYMLHPDAKGKRYRWDPRQPLNTLFEKAGLRKSRYKNLARFARLKNQKEAAAKRAKLEAKLAEADKAWGNKEEMSIHTMRHSYGSHHVRRGVPLARVALWMGDRQRTVETNYLHEDAEQILDEATTAERLSELLKKLESAQPEKMHKIVADEIAAQKRAAALAKKFRQEKPYRNIEL